jgi:hypothetical protein
MILILLYTPPSCFFQVAFRMLRLLDSKTRIFCPSEAKNARFQASLSSPAWRGTMPVQPSNGFFTHKPSQIMSTDFAGENQRADVSAFPTVAL